MGVIDGITGLVGTITNKIAPDKTEVIQSDNQVATAQIQMNQAAIVVGRATWIDLVGKTCAWGLIFQVLVRPALCAILTLAPLFGVDAHLASQTCSNLPQIDLPTLLSILLPMLGITFHTFVTGKR